LIHLKIPGSLIHVCVKVAWFRDVTGSRTVKTAQQPDGAWQVDLDLAAVRSVAVPAWRVSLQDHHPGYIGWEEFLHNQQRLEKNRTNGEETVLTRPARESLALL
jgi:hypothetical protein